MVSDLLDQIQQRQESAQNQQLAQTDANNIWAQTFNSVPASDKALASQDLNDMIAQVTARKQAAIEASNPTVALAHARTQEVLDRTKHANDMAPLAVQFKQAQFKAQQALEQRHLAEATKAAGIKEHEDAFFADRAQFQHDNPDATQAQLDANDIANGAKYNRAKNGTNEVGSLLAAANQRQRATSEATIRATALKTYNEQAATDAQTNGLELKGRSATGHDIYGKPKDQQTQEEKLKEAHDLALARSSGTAEGHPAKANSAQTLSGAIAGAFNAGQVTFGALGVNKQGKDDVIPNTVPGEQATHAKVIYTTPGGKVEPGIFTIAQLQKHLHDAGGAATPAVVSAPTFLPGATAVKNGVTYVRGEDGKWLPKQ
jgi:hypothetical protein